VYASVQDINEIETHLPRMIVHLESFEFISVLAPGIILIHLHLDSLYSRNVYLIALALAKPVLQAFVSDKIENNLFLYVQKFDF